MQFKDMVMQRYATKKFDSKKISDGKISELLELVLFAPSALNLQPWKIKIVTDRNEKEQLLPVSDNQEHVTTSCSHLLVFCADADYEGLIRRLGSHIQKEGVPMDMNNMVIGT
jgi:nitroreductase